MKERPILFSAPMVVRAILDGSKTQTRRVKPPFLGCLNAGLGANHDPCPYGQSGDRLWVRETWAPRTLGAWPIMDQHLKPLYRASEDRPEWKRIWKRSIHMPRWASRITLEITAVRVERLHDISEADALAEGIWNTISGYYSYGDEYNPSYKTARDAYRALWESINGPGSWDANPWVWVIEFKKLEGKQ